MLKDLLNEFKRLENKDKARIYSRFFKTGTGQYGEGDKFLGISVPDQRRLAKKYKDINLKEIQELLESIIHEYRLTALIILVDKYYNSDALGKKKIVNFYVRFKDRINNWDLVDISAHHILGSYLIGKDKSILLNLARSDNIWDRRISIIATFSFIKSNSFDYTLKISRLLLNDKHDLIHKAVGWMLREVGKRNQDIEKRFLEKYHMKMPRTMLRYAIEKFDIETRNYYLNK